MIARKNFDNNSQNFFDKLVKFFFRAWLLCIAGAILTVVYVVGIRKELFNEAPDVFFFILSGFVLFGLLSFGILFLILIFKSSLISVLASFRKGPEVVFGFKLLLLFIFFPFVLLFKTITPEKITGKIKFFSKPRINASFFERLIKMMFIFTVILPTWVAGYFSVFYFPALLLGVIPSPSEVQIIGHSMLPTLEEDKLENVYLYSSVAANFRKLQRGDIVVFNAADLADGEAVSYIKRVVAIPGDRIEIRDGFFYLNGEITVEPYTLKPRSTFGSKDFLPDCKEVVVSDKHVFVLGDNRARSRDSRDLGFISISSITGTIPYSKQEKLKNKWRDVSHDKERAGLASFEANDYYQLLNEKRQEAGLPLLVVNEKLEVAARKRARAIIENNEIDISPSDSKYPIDKAQREAGYFNIVHGEIFTYGYFDAEDLLGHYFEFGEKYLLNKEYQDAGVGAVVGKINGCEVQVIVQEFGGYVPPNYNQENIDSWRNILLQLKEVQPSWARLKDYQEFYEKNKTDIDRINEILSIRIANISTIVAKMEANQWLTAEERKMADQDKALYEEQESLAKKLNSQ